MKETWQSIAKTLRKRGWNYQEIRWLLPGHAGNIAWEVTVLQCDDKERVLARVGAERATLLAAYRAVLKETERSRSA
jgi:hypothetical protein